MNTVPADFIRYERNFVYNAIDIWTLPGQRAAAHTFLVYNKRFLNNDHNYSFI